MTLSRSKGNWGEDIAADYLKRQGLRLLERQFTTPMGEVDLIFLDKDLYVFVEVKARESDPEVSALESITSAKQRRVVRASMAYMKRKGLIGEGMRFDVITIEGGHVEWYPNAFDPPNHYTL